VRLQMNACGKLDEKITRTTLGWGIFDAFAAA
jgi:hypothetical protein